MKYFFILIAITFTISLFAQQNPSEQAPNLFEINPSTSYRDTFNLQFSFPCTAFIGEYGIESDGDFIYVTQWRDDSIAKYDASGTVIETFVIPGVGQIRDLAWDGTYFYGSPNDYFIYVLDFETKTLVNTITTDIKIRGMAYDEDNDILWASEHWSPSFFRLDKENGSILDTLAPSGITLDAISGLAYDNVSPGGPFLWGFSQDSTGAIIIKYDIPNQTQTGNMIDVSGLTGQVAYAGGLYIEQMDGMTGISIGGMLQNDLIFSLELGYANQLVGVDNNTTGSEIIIYPNPARNHLNISFTNIEGKSKIVQLIDARGQTLKEFRIQQGTNKRISLEGIPKGLYFLKMESGFVEKIVIL